MTPTVELTSVTKTDPNELAFERTWLAQERSMMAWIRTSTSLITFGLAYYKFFVSIQHNEQLGSGHRFLSPRGFGLMMIGLGIFSLAIATVQHHQQQKILRKQYPAIPRSLSLLVAAFISFVGICAFIEAILP